MSPNVDSFGVSGCMSMSARALTWFVISLIWIIFIIRELISNFYTPTIKWTRISIYIALSLFHLFLISTL